MNIAWAVSKRSTCVRRAVGCVLINGLGHIVGTGYNGRPRGMIHCNEEVRSVGGAVPSSQQEVYPHACKGAFDPRGTKDQSRCEAVHSEVNALMQCYDTLWVRTAYVTRSPCVPCVKVLLNSGCLRIVWDEPASDVEAAGELWTRNNAALGGHGELREWTRFQSQYSQYQPNPTKARQHD